MKIKMTQKAAALLCTVALLLAGCGGNTAQSDAGGLPQVVNIGTQQIPNDEALAAAKGYFEQEMGVKVNIVEFQAGDIRNAMISKDIDFAMLGSSSAILGVANGMDVQLVWVHEVLGSAEQLVAREGSGVKTIQDLKGKKVATPFTSTAHYSLLNALKLNGIDEADVTLLDMQMPDIYAAWQRGDIDAAYGWEPTLSKLLESGTSLLTSADLAAQGVITANVEIVRSEFAQQYPQLVAGYIRAVDRAVQLYRQNPDDAVATVAQAMGLTQQEAKTQMQGSIWLTAAEQLSPDYLGTSAQKGHFVEVAKDTADFLYSQKSLISQPDAAVFEQFVNPAYIEQAVQPS